MGVAGCGKSTIGEQLAGCLSLPFIEGDSLHPRENVESMAQGRPLNDEMRIPWLNEITARLKGTPCTGLVVSCSALKRVYRDRLRQGGDVLFVHIDVPRDVLAARMENRQHFMPVSLLDSQLATLEALEPDEFGIVINGEMPVSGMIEQIKAQLESVD